MKKLLGMLLIVVMIFVVGCGTQGSSGNAKQNGSAQEQEKQKDDESKKTDPAKGEKKTLAVGEKFTLKDWDVTLESFEFNKSVKDNIMSSSTEDGNKYLILRLNVTNNGTTGDDFIKMIGGVSIKAVYNDKYEYQNSITLIDGDLAKKKIQPLSNVKGFTVIKVPDKVVEGPEGIDVIFQNDGQKAQVKIR